MASLHLTAKALKLSWFSFNSAKEFANNNHDFQHIFIAEAVPKIKPTREDYRYRHVTTPQAARPTPKLAFQVLPFASSV